MDGRCRRCPETESDPPALRAAIRISGAPKLGARATSAGIAPAYEVSERRTTRYLCDPHLDQDAAHRAEALQVPLFGETLLLARPQIELYQHEASWANRLILGDSLLMMNSLLVKEGMAARCR